jgi:uncharacterized protein (DUF1697 family)
LLRGINVVGNNKVPMKALAGALDAAGFGSVFYLWTPDGFPDSVLRSRIERCLGVPATARNWRTVNELLKLLS